MSANGPILILEDDVDDQFIIELAFTKLKTTNRRQYFATSDEFLKFLMVTEEQPLIILSDINMPKASGIELKKSIESNSFLKAKTIPYVFLTTSAHTRDVLSAYDLHTQGFFVKSTTFDEMKETLGNILEYWQRSLHPNNI